MRRRVPYLFIAPVLAGALLLGGCGESAGSQGSGESQQEQGGSETKSEGESGGGSEARVASIDSIEIEGKKGKKPKLVGFEGPVKFEETDTKVLDEGDGKKVGEGQNVRVHYIGFNARNGKSFDDSYSRGESTVFSLEKGSMITGFVKGLTGQKVGSRVLIGMPSKDGYPDGNKRAGIKKGDSLMFVVEIKDAWTPLAKATGQAVDPPKDLPKVQVNDKNEVTGVEDPGSAPPKQLVTQPLIHGDGDKVTKQSTVELHMYAESWKDGKLVQNTWKSGRTAQLPIAQLSSSAPGIAEALIGRKVGDRVLVVLPPSEPSGQQKGQSKTPPTIGVIDILDAY